MQLFRNDSVSLMIYYLLMNLSMKKNEPYSDATLISCLLLMASLSMNETALVYPELVTYYSYLYYYLCYCYLYL